MRPRIAMARFLLRLSDFIKSLPVIVMRPDDLIEFSRQTYARPDRVTSWSEPAVLNAGLYPSEQTLLERLPRYGGRLLLLGVGGGREAIPLVRLGYEVTGVDFVPAMVEQAQANAARQGLRIAGLVQEISQLDVPAGSFDVVWLSAAMYSCVPTRHRRVEMLRRIHRALVPGGHFVCQFHWDPGQRRTRFGLLVRRALAALTLGNLAYEPGDLLWGSVEFIHAFGAEAAVRSEFVAGGFEVIYMHIPEEGMRAGAILRKPGAA